VYGANIDIRDFSGKMAFNYLKANQRDKKTRGVRLTLHVVLFYKHIMGFYITQEFFLLHIFRYYVIIPLLKFVDDNRENWPLNVGIADDGHDYINGFFSSLHPENSSTRFDCEDSNFSETPLKRKSTERSSSFFRGLLPKQQHL
jgi:hypothetical protein